MPADTEHKNTKFAALIKFLNMLKKPADMLDDTWSALRGFLPELIIELVGPFLIGSLFLFINLLEIENAAEDFYEVSHNEKMRQRKTRYITSILSFLLAGTGLGLCATLLLGGFGQLGLISVAVSGMAIFPFLIPTALLCIYSLSLWKHSYVLYRSNRIEEEARSHFELYISNPNYHKAEADKLFNVYKEAYHNRLDAEREVALTTLEVAGSALICTGILLGTAALIGGSIASLGALPIGLLIAGVVIGFTSKYIEWKDGKQDFAFTKKMRNYFRKKFDLPDDEPRWQYSRGHMPLCNPELSVFVPGPDSVNAREEARSEPNYRYRMWKTSEPKEIEMSPNFSEHHSLTH